MLIMLALTVDEVVATVTFLVKAHREGALLTLLTLPRGAIKERHGDWQKYIV